MRYFKFLVCVASLLAITACDDDGVSVPPPPEPMALVRFINAVPDTGTVDLRFVDRVENLPTLQGVAFRSTSGTYQPVHPGTRAARIFPFSTNAVLTQVRLVDMDLPLQGDTRYTLVYAGRASAGAPESERHRLVVIDDLWTLPTPGANQVAIQVLHAAVGIGNVDVYLVPVDSLTVGTPEDWATNNAGMVANVPYLGKAAYMNVPVRPAIEGDLYRFVVTPSGSTTPLFAATAKQPGIPASAGQLYGAQPGVQVSGSVMTAIIASGSTPGTRGSTTATQTPTVVLAIDKPLDP